MKITHVRRDGKGRIQQVKLEDGRILDKDEAISLTNSGAIEGTEVRPSKSGDLYIRSIADGDLSNNLDQLPQF